MRQMLDQVMKAVDASADESSAVIPAAYLFQTSLQAVVTGTSTGTLKYQFSNDLTLPPSAPTHWSDVPSATVAIAGAGTYGIGKTDLCYQWIKITFVHTNAAAGTLTVNIKTLGM